MQIRDLFLSVILAGSPCFALWSTQYAFNGTSVYLYLRDGTVLHYTGEHKNSDSLGSEDIISSMNWISSPPSQSHLAIDSDDTLWSVSGDGTCQQSPLDVHIYDPTKNSWIKFATSTSNWQLDQSSVWTSGSGNDKLIYIYGGACAGTIYNKLYAYNISSNQFQEEELGIVPASLYKAAVIPISDTDAIVIGGKSTSGWIDMNQVALWESQSWTFKSVLNYTDIDSRTDTLLLPLSNSIEPLGSVETILAVGGDVSSRKSYPQVAEISLSANKAWSWTAPPNSADIVSNVDNIIGAFTLGKFLLTVTNITNTATSTNFSVQIYDSTQNYNTVTSLTLPSSTATQHVSTPTAATTVSEKPSSSATVTAKSDSSSNLSTGGIAAISTIIPLSILGGAAALGLFFFRRKKKRVIPYQSYASPPSRSMQEFDGFYDPNPNPWYSKAHSDSESMDSWNEKREQYESDNLKKKQSRISLTSTESEEIPLPVHTPIVPAPAKVDRVSHRRIPSTSIAQSSVPENDDDDASDREVQVLVSSRRRTRLVIANPDPDNAEIANNKARVVSGSNVNVRNL